MFTFAMQGHVDVVRGMVKAQPGIQKTRGPHGFTLMYHAKVGGDKAKLVVEYLKELGDADIGEPDSEIPKNEKDKIIGLYSFGKDDDEQIQILMERGELRIKRPGRVGRRLARDKELTFHPAGAPAVKVHFEKSDGKIVRLIIRDGHSTLKADRR